MIINKQNLRNNYGKTTKDEENMRSTTMKKKELINLLEGMKDCCPNHPYFRGFNAGLERSINMIKAYGG